MVALELELMGRLILAVVLGGLVGLEREMHGRPAGFRTHILVCLGSALVMVVSFHPFSHLVAQGVDADPTRIAAQVVSGIGFLGAGTILREGASIRGLTTAASLWVVAGIGLAVGAGYYAGALLTTALVVVSLFWLNRIEMRFVKSRQGTVVVRIIDRPGQLAAVSAVLGQHGVNIRGVEIEREDGEAELTFLVDNLRPSTAPQLLEELRALDGVAPVEWHA